MHTNPHVEAALGDCSPVVALETAVVTHGLPRDAIPVERVPPAVREFWDGGIPANVALGRALLRAVRESGATPAMVGVIDGTLTIGLSDDELTRLARERAPAKASTRDLAACAIRGASAGTTVASTLHACTLARPRPVRVATTGGVGGVHRGWREDVDISADLAQLATTPVCIVCSGPKSLLDAHATMAAIEALRVPVIGFGCDRAPSFVCGQLSHAPRLSLRLESADEIAAFCAVHWNHLRSATAVVVMRPCDSAVAIDQHEWDHALNAAEAEASARGITGADLTPFILSRTAELTGGRSLAANLTLLIENARLAALVARAYSLQMDRK